MLAKILDYLAGNKREVFIFLGGMVFGILVRSLAG
jgi:hypothetical protein